MPDDDKTNVTATAPVVEKRTKGRFPVYLAGLNVNSYLQTVEIYFKLNQTPNDEKALEFITSVGQETANRIIGSFKPEKIVNKSYEQIIEKFQKLHEENKNVFAERYRLISRKQAVGESLDDFAIDLQDIVEHCGVKVETEAVLVQSIFVAGLKNDNTREIMLREGSEELDLAKLLEKAKSIETATQESRKMAQHEIVEVNYIDRRGASAGFSRNVVKRSSMGEATHAANRNADLYNHRGSFRPSSSTVCYNCYNKGHLSYECTFPKSKKPRNSAPTPPKGAGYKLAYEERINQLTAAMEELKSSLQDDSDLSDKQSADGSEDDSPNLVNNVNSLLLGKLNTTPAFVDLTINGKNITLECDTGACATICSLETYEKYFNKIKLIPIHKHFYVVSGDKVSVVGTLPVQVKLREKLLHLTIVVIKSLREFTPLLGRDWLNVIWPDWRESFALNSIHIDARKR